LRSDFKFQTAVDLNILPDDSDVSVDVVGGVDDVIGVVDDVIGVVFVDARDFDDRSTLKLVTKCDMEEGLSVLVLERKIFGLGISVTEFQP
jgi:hypothetical protein